jgi:hypothetical protein
MLQEPIKLSRREKTIVGLEHNLIKHDFIRFYDGVFADLGGQDLRARFEDTMRLCLERYRSIRSIVLSSCNIVTMHEVLWTKLFPEDQDDPNMITIQAIQYDIDTLRPAFTGSGHVIKIKLPAGWQDLPGVLSCFQAAQLPMKDWRKKKQ